MVTGDWRIVNMPITAAALGESDTMTCRTPKASRNGSPSSTISHTVLLECGGAPPLLANGYCQEITSSESVNVVVAPLSGGAFPSFPPDHAITPIASGVGPAPVLALYGFARRLS